jgi:histidinol phosphatase-like enzyme (inositol monophosphatase family)
MPWDRELEAARAAAVAAGEVALKRLEFGLCAEDKPDCSPVTDADRDCEQVITAMLSEAFPRDGFLGEEGGARGAASRRRWIIDPIDGTRDYMRGSAGWAVLIALEEAGEIVVGVANMPAMGNLYWAVQGRGAWRNAVRLRVSNVGSPSRAVLCLGGLQHMKRMPFASRLVEYMSSYWSVRSFGGCLDCLMVAEGKADAWIDPTAEPWDLAALGLIAREAGASVFNFGGGNSIYGRNCVVCTPGLEQDLRSFTG